MRLSLAALLAMVGAAGTAAPAASAERPVFDVTTVQVHEVATVTPATSSHPDFRPHLNFPYLKHRADGTLEAYYAYGQTQSGAQWAVQALSHDGGRTWTGHTSPPPPVMPNSSLVRGAGQTSIGVSMGFDLYAPGRPAWNNGVYRSTDGGSSWSIASAHFDAAGVSYVSAYNSHNDLVESDGTLFHVSQGQRLGADKFESLLWASTDGGANWTRRSTIAQHTASVNYGAMGDEGPSETALARLDSGDLLAVFRTGQPFPSSDIQGTSPPLFWAMSEDDGHTWSPAKSLGVAGVYPQLHTLDDGSVALTYGRYGAKMLFADETGRRWSTPHAIYNGPGSGHTDLSRGTDGEYVFLYDQSSFYPPSWNASPPAAYRNIEGGVEIGRLKAARLTITRQAVEDDYTWAHEFHGDKTPDTYNPAWSVNQGGTVGGYLWAEQAQDYYRLDTKTGGGAAFAYYSMNGGGSGSAWDGLSFDEGVVIDFRARISGAVSEGAAGLVFGDGDNGHGLLELTSGGVILQGDADNAGQVLFGETAGFSTDQWHTYRILIDVIGGSMTARVFLDGGATPILAKALNPAFLDSVYFGDLTESVSGVLEIDFLRFGSQVPEPGVGVLVAMAGWPLLGSRRRTRGTPRR